MITPVYKIQREFALRTVALRARSGFRMSFEEASQVALGELISEFEASLAARLCRCDANDTARSRTVPRCPDTVPLRMNPPGESMSSPGRGSGPTAHPSNTWADKP